MAVAACHGLGWLVISNGIGLLLGLLLLVPRLNACLGELTYGHWVPLHMNLNLYGWCSLPLVAWLLRVFQADRPPVSPWSATAVWAWSLALAGGACSWLTGHVSGKLFLDWEGFALDLLALAMLWLWVVLVASFCVHRGSEAGRPLLVRLARAGGLLLLLCVPLALYWAAGPRVYPPVNPDTGGPTGGSLLESSLGIIAILLMVPVGLGRKARSGSRVPWLAWGLFVADNLVYLSLGRGNTSHHSASEILGLGTLLLWVPVLPAYFGTYEWPRCARRWAIALLCWWGLLVVTAWLIFLPGVLDHAKFTDMLVGHSHMAMAGFISTLNGFLIAVLLGGETAVLDSRRAFLAWQTGTLGYVVLMFAAGWLEGADPAFTVYPGLVRNLLYVGRLGCGILMMSASVCWWKQVAGLVRRPATVQRAVDRARHTIAESRSLTEAR